MNLTQMPSVATIVNIAECLSSGSLGRLKVQGFYSAQSHSHANPITL